MKISNSEIKFITQLKSKKYRQKYGHFIAEGVKSVDELLTSGMKCKMIVLNANFNNGNYYIPNGIETRIADNSIFKNLSTQATPSGIIGIFKWDAKSLIPEELYGKITIVLYNIQDPGNLGTIIRIADWYGIENIICSKGCVDCTNPKTIHATMGSISRVSIYYEEIEPLLKKTTIPSFASVINGDNIYTIQKTQEALIIIGNESNGIDNTIINLCDKKISIPKRGNAESLNAGVATAIIIDNFLRA